ncbi:MAG TPA: MEDS domain-containing protein [Nitrososphaeraceae archaeon]|nr:MEDS domain-containing protein [Nitrososphaeraceae archaeon]
MLYPDITTLPYIYSNYSKSSLESLNEIVLILPHYHLVADVINNLTSNGIDTEKCKREGSIIIIESKKGYYSLTDEFIGVMIMTKMLLRRANKLGKTGVTVISDMGLFFHLNRIEDLIKYEIGLSSSIYDMKVKVLCSYNKTDFERSLKTENSIYLNIIIKSSLHKQSSKKP